MTEPRAADDYFRLRAEWLRFKNHVFDVNSGLPTMAAVLDDVRRLMEERGTLALVYIDLGAQGALEPVHGWQTYDELLRAFARTLLALRDHGQLGTRDIVATMSVRSDKFLVFIRGGDGSPIDAAGVEERARRLREALREALPAHLPPGVDPPVAFDMGHALMYRDPMLRAERSIHRALDEAMFMSLRERSMEEGEQAHGLDHIIAGGRVHTMYQPILDLRTQVVVGHEVFTHGPAGGPFEEAERLFAMAERTGRLIDLERLSRARALGSARRHLQPGAKLFLNTSARALHDSEVAGAGFMRLAEESGLRHEDVVLEITDRVPREEREPYQHVLRELKEHGFGIAIDDMGAGYSSLSTLVELEPDYLKFDITLVRGIDRSSIKRSLLETVVELSGRIGAQVIAEGIEAEAELTTLRDMGVPLGQGRFLAAPMAVPVDAPVAP
ncbi:MAG TPA: EAL domain-containing protein [Vicinamibacteria bacterium]|nr:EAL domain-containing protein [Vicinamibacteria bacterium]